MYKCHMCGSHYDKIFKLMMKDAALHALAPVCSHCGCKIIGHGLLKDGGHMPPSSL